MDLKGAYEGSPLPWVRPTGVFFAKKGCNHEKKDYFIALNGFIALSYNYSHCRCWGPKSQDLRERRNRKNGEYNSDYCYDIGEY